MNVVFACMVFGRRFSLVAELEIMEEAAEVSNLNEVMRKLKLHTDASAELDYGKENIDAAKNRRQSNPEFAHWSKGLKQGPRTFYPAGPGSVPNPPCNNYAMGPQTSQIQCGACGQFTSYIPADLYQPSTANPAVRDTNYARRSNELLPTLFTKNIPYGRTYYGVPHSRPYDRQGVHSDENWKQVPEQAVEPASFNGRIFPIHAADNFNTNTPATAELGPRMGGLGNRNSRSIVCNSGQYGKGDMALECEWRNVLNEQNRGPRAMRRQRSSLEQEEAVRGTGDKHYNLLDSLPEYEQANFFVIKSYSEDDVHKSIKYNVWSSTRNGNKRLDVAYKDAQAIAAENSSGCPVFLLFSVNNSGQFCGVAEMIGPVDFGKSMDFWQQDRWMGCFPVKWHIIKDVPNSKLRHIIVENNDHKPVTNSRDTQEVKFEKGVEILSIFQRFKAETTILDDFFFYEQRYNTLQEIRATQHAAAAPTGCGSSAFR